MVVESLQMLAAAPSTQIAYVRNNGFHQDELALELDGVLEAFLGNCPPSKGASFALRALDRQLDKMSGERNAALWTDRALRDAEEWMTVRRLATRSLQELHEGLASPTELFTRTRRDQTSKPSDEAAYGLVLRHIIEGGHGWGKQPSPLRGLYVLNRTISWGVDDPEFDIRAFEDAEIGIPFSREVMRSLAGSLKNVTDLEFVPTLLELVDLGSTQHIQVKGSRGFVALGSIHVSDRDAVIGAYFYAGGRWSRTLRYQLVERDGQWGITTVEIISVS
jgi:hypothetical protein